MVVQKDNPSFMDPSAADLEKTQYDGNNIPAWDETNVSSFKSAPV